MDATGSCRAFLGPGLECGLPFHGDGEPRAGFSAVNNAAEFRGKEESWGGGEDQKIVRGGGEKWRASGRMRRAPDRDPAWPRWAGGQCPSSRPETGHNGEKACWPRSAGGVRSHILSLEGQAEPPSQMQGRGEGGGQADLGGRDTCRPRCGCSCSSKRW